MSDVASGRSAAPSPGLLSPVTVAILLGVGMLSFVAMLVLGAYAPDLGGEGRGRPGGHALSRAVTGYSGIVALAKATRRNPRIVRSDVLLATEDLVVATPTAGSVPVDPVLDPRGATPTLLVLPKWATGPHRQKRGWVTVYSLIDRDEPEGVLAPATTFRVVRGRSGGRPLRTVEPLMTGVRFTAPRPLQAIRPDTVKPGAAYGRLEPLVVDDAGNIVVGQFTGLPLFLLADPDLLDNRGMHDAGTAASALAMLDYMNSNEAEGIAFDVTLNGLGRSPSPLKLLFEPPFLAVTLALAVALLLAVLGTVTRFGSPRPRARAIAFGKTALVDNTAVLVRKAGREARLGPRYAEVVREAAVRAFGVPARLHGSALDDYLDRLGRGAPVTRLSRSVAEAGDKDELMRAAGALHAWLRRRDA
jgi:hypothetical protein